ncbi:MAG TPA: branched-chain amino acid ABC transporter ATP-binding protein [Gammaproteobacteria bacterium]|nr:ABC transporter ATP-binding protein [Arenicellales bacterium]MDP6531654.1 ABC transporter ATP-binding protein [Arenicellales bacterium]MDP6853944.1 ABC transporter ATP-binding protein [Arenicellales bacterium]MDP6947837.1 ABC transporter ATP-binding protein [Arenicellales bacterium]HCY12935.1 branched-chain amino acid ABC transporter ATP-binding protein [Gammaproteobacteria bacterium]
MLNIESLVTRYGTITAVRDVGLTVRAGEVVCLIGPNGAGKTTLLATVAGLLRPSAGRVTLDDADVTGWAPDRMLRAGLALVPEHRRIFSDFTVRENLLVGGITQPASRRQELLDEMVSLFPILEERLSAPAGYLSGGEAQQLAIGRALMSDPAVLLMDEPSLGLAPVLVDQVFDLIGRLREGGRTLFVVEQNAKRMLAVADRAYVMRSGEIVADGPAAQLAASEDLFETYLGQSGGTA